MKQIISVIFFFVCVLLLEDIFAQNKNSGKFVIDYNVLTGEAESISYYDTTEKIVYEFGTVYICCGQSIFSSIKFFHDSLNITKTEEYEGAKLVKSTLAEKEKDSSCIYIREVQSREFGNINSIITRDKNGNIIEVKSYEIGHFLFFKKKKLTFWHKYFQYYTARLEIKFCR